MNKKIFISYSWTTQQHQEWVLDLAHRLVSDGVETVLDKWDLKVGHDKYAFMEQMVGATDIDKVLVILDKAYAEKADGRLGGVGTETTIISAEVYQKATQEKFIPIVTEKNEEGKPYTPIFLKSRIFIDLSSDEFFTEEYEKLLREIYARPSLSKPKLGTPPSYLFEDTPFTHKTSTILRSFDSQVDRSPTRANSLLKDFLDEFVKNLGDFSMKDKSQTYFDYGKELVENLTKLLPLRDDYIVLIDKLAKQNENLDLDILVNFFESLPLKLTAPNAPEYWREHRFQNFRFLIHEIFLYTVAIAIKRENYEMLETFIQTPYYLGLQYRNNSEPSNFEEFYFHTSDIEQYYKQHTGKNLIDCHATLLVERLSNLVSKEEFINADLFCYYISKTNNGNWFPITIIHKNDRSSSFPLFNRLSSKRHFEKVKKVFAAESKEDFINHVQSFANETERAYSNGFTRIPALTDFIPLDDIGKYR